MPGLNKKDSETTECNSNSNESNSTGLSDIVESHAEVAMTNSRYSEIYARPNVRPFWPVLDGVLQPVPSYGVYRSGRLMQPLPIQGRFRQPLRIGRGSFGGFRFRAGQVEVSNAQDRADSNNNNA